MNRFQHDNLDPDLTPKRRETALKTKLSGPGTKKKRLRREAKTKR